MSRKYFIIISILVAAAICLYLANKYWLDKTYSREWLVKNFNTNQRAFSEVVGLFQADITKSKQENVTFGLGNWGSINLFIFPAVVDPANKVIGGNDLKLGSAALDSVLAKIGWDEKTVEQLRTKLEQTNCDWIRVVSSQGNSIEMYPDQRGWGSYTYIIHTEPISDSLIQLNGRPLGDSGFARRAELDYRSAL
jgi:hypothetical protein